MASWSQKADGDDYTSPDSECFAINRIQGGESMRGRHLETFLPPNTRTIQLYLHTQMFLTAPWDIPERAGQTREVGVKNGGAKGIHGPTNLAI